MLVEPRGFRIVWTLIMTTEAFDLVPALLWVKVPVLLLYDHGLGTCLAKMHPVGGRVCLWSYKHIGSPECAPSLALI